MRPELPLATRLLQPSDALQYRGLRLQNLRDHPHAFTSSYEEESLKAPSEDVYRLTPDPTKPHDFFLGAFHGDTLVGMAGLKGAYRRSERHIATVVGMMVSTPYRRQGLGEALVQTLLAQAQTLPTLDQLVLTVTEGNTTAQNLYARCGFVVYGVLPKAIKIGDTFYGKVQMVLDLKR